MHFNLAICSVHFVVAVPSGLRVNGWKISHLSTQVQAKVLSLCGQHFDLLDVTRWSSFNIRDLNIVPVADTRLSVLCTPYSPFSVLTVRGTPNALVISGTAVSGVDWFRRHSTGLFHC